MLVYKTINEIAKDKQMSMTAVNNWLKTGKIIKLTVKADKNRTKVHKKVGYLLTIDALRSIVEMM